MKLTSLAPEAYEFTDAETRAMERFNQHRKDDKTVQDAAMLALNAMLTTDRTPEFVDHLSEGTVRLTYNLKVKAILPPRAGRPILTVEGNEMRGYL